MKTIRCLYCVYVILLQVAQHLTQIETAVEDCTDPHNIKMNRGCKLTIVPLDEDGVCTNVKEIIKNLCPVSILKNKCKGDTLEEIIENGCLVQLISICETIAEIIANQCEVQIIPISPGTSCETIAEIIANQCEVQIIPISSGISCETIAEIIANQCEVQIIPIGTSLVGGCVACSPPVRVDNKPKFAPKILCRGELSFATVNGQRCKKNEFGFNTCMMGGEGFSFCSTEYLFFRDGHWVDWDLCSLCTKDDPSSPLTAHGYRCDGDCNNLWQNKEIDAPRCKVKDKSADEPSLDFCTTCTSSCANVKVDDRPGSQVSHLTYGNSTK